MTTSVTQPGSPRKSVYREAEKIAFLAAYDQLENVADAAATASVTVMVGYRWLVASGIDPRRRSYERRAEFDRLRAIGTSRSAAAQQVGVHIRTAIDWDQGIRKSGGARIHADGRVVGYNYVMPQLTERRARLAKVEQLLDARYLSLEERERIRDVLATGASIRDVATVLDRSASTISRELRRNVTTTGTYEPYTAHRMAADRRPRPKPAKLVHRPRLREYVQSRLGIRWSPEQICHALIKKFPHDQEMHVSPETVYQALYLQARGGLKTEVQVALRTGRPSHRSRPP